jgi:hypothetical protein
MTWRVRYKRVAPQGYADMDTLTFARKDLWKVASLPWRGMASTNAVSKKERLMNKSTEAIIKLYDEVTRDLMDDLEDSFCEQFYIDGTTTANAKLMHGIESFLSNNGTLASGLVGAPNSTFAGLDCTLGAYGGTWTPGSGHNWPDGRGDASQSYDFWSPLIVDYTNTGWTAGTKTWPNTCLEATRFAILNTHRNKSKRGRLDLIMLSMDLYRSFMDKVATEERIVIERGKKQSLLIALGYPDVISYDGVDVTTEYGVPSATGYLLNTSMMELRSLQGQLFVPEGPAYDEATKTYRFSVDFFGNTTWNPRHFGALKALS